jgi:hypothetical protein
MNQSEWIPKFINLLQLGPGNEVFKFQSNFIPSKLFKYFSFSKWSEEILGSLQTDRIWISNPDTMNDPYDSALYFVKNDIANKLLKEDFDGFKLQIKMDKWFSEDEIKEVRKSNDMQKKIVEMLQINHPEQSEKIQKVASLMENFQDKIHEETLSQFNKKLKSSLKLTCFSEKNDSLLMWSHYTDSHKGFCVEYNFNSLGYYEFPNRFLFPVYYTDKLFDVTAILLQKTISASLLPLLAALYKSSEWSYEHEWRLIIPFGLIQDDSYYQIISASAIYLGSRITDGNKEKLLMIGRKKNIPVFQMKLISSSFKLESNQIS